MFAFCPVIVIFKVEADVWFGLLLGQYFPKFTIGLRLKWILLEIVKKPSKNLFEVREHIANIGSFLQICEKWWLKVSFQQRIVAQ
jgi:hypothetical protein